MTKRAQLPDGRILEFPDDTPDAVVQRVVKEQLGIIPPKSVPAPTPTPAPAPTATPTKEEPGFFDVVQSYTTDIPVRTLKGALGGIEMGTNIFGADNFVSDILRGAQEGINEYLVSDTAKQRAEERSKRLEGKGFFGTLAEVPGIVADDPALLAETLGTALPSIGAAVFTGGSSVAVQGAAVLGTGAAMGAGAIKGSIYDATKEELLKTGRVTEEEAERAASEAQSYVGDNLDMIALGAALGTIASRTGMEPAAARLLAGRIIGKSVGQAAGRETMETALRQSAQRGAVRTAIEESTLEGAQGAQEKLAANLALQRQGMDVDLMEGVGSAAALEGTLGGILGGGLGLAGRGAPVEASPKANLAASPQVEQEYLRLVTAEAQALRDQNPKLTQRQAFNQVMKDAGKLYDTAITNILLGAEGGADAGAGVDVSAGVGAGTAPDLGAVPPAPGAPVAGAPVGGGLAEAAPSVSVPAVGAGAGVSALAPTVDEVATAPIAAAIQSVTAPVTGPVPTIAQAAAREAGIAPSPAAPEVAVPEVAAPATEFDPILLPVYEAPNMAERKKAAKSIIGGIIDQTAGDVVVPAKVTNQIATQMAQRAARREVFDPVEITQSVLTEQGIIAAPKVEQPMGERPGTFRTVTNINGQQATVEGLTPTPAAPPTAIDEELAARDQEVSQELLAPEVQTEPTVAETATVEEAAPVPTATPQEILADLDSFAVSEAQDRDLDPDMFLNGVTDIREGREPLPLFEFARQFGFISPGESLRFSLEERPVDRAYDAYKAGTQFAQDRIAEAQAAAPTPTAPTPTAPAAAPTAAPTPAAPEVPPTAAPPGAPPPPPPPPPPTPPAATGGPGGPAPKKPTVVSNGKPVVLTEAQTRTALAKAKAYREKMNRIQKRIAATNDMDDVLSGGIDLVKLTRGDATNWALLRGAIDTLDVGKWKLILPTLSTGDIFRILKGRIPALTESDRIVRQDIPRFLSKEYSQLAEELEEVSAFLKKYPKAAQALSDLEFATVAYQVDPTKAPTAEDYFNRVDKKAKELRAKIKAEKDVKKKGRLETSLKTRFDEIESVYKGVPGDERVIGWQALGRPEFGGGKGREIFKLLRDGHRRDLEAKYNALRSRLMETKKDEDLDEALDRLEAQFKPALDQVIYFPAMRFGSYYARVGSGANSVFKMFETETQRNQFVRVMEARGEEVTETGNVEDLRNQFTQVTGGPLKEVLDLFDDNPKDIGALKSQVFDLWLQTMSAGDMRKHMAPRKMRAGYSTDILKNFANFRRSSINDVKRAKYGYKLRTEISRAKEFVAEQPDRDKMNVFVKEIELRALGSLMPEDRSNPKLEAAIQLGNKAAFYQYLANPKTAVIQLSQLHVAVLPILAQQYGHRKAVAALGKYAFSALGGFVASPLKAVKGDPDSIIPSFDWEQPNLLDNPISTLKKESDPELYEVLSEGWNEGRELNLYMDTFANQIGGYGAGDPQQRSALQELMRGRVHTATWRGATFALEAMGTLMHQMERVNREATYMAALELGYRENRKSGQTHEEAKKNAIESAVDTTLEATFDFSSYNKPRVFTTGVGRVAGQFMSYPYMMSSLLVRKLYTAIRRSKNLNPGERVAAIEVATGTLLNMFAYAGVTGIPLYGIFTTVASLALWAASQFDDEDEEGALSYIDENGNIKATYDIDWWFRNVWIPKFMGLDGTSANLFGMDDATAELTARALEKGPISAITDIDLSNSVALDFLFFLPEEPRAETTEGKIAEYAINFLGGAAFGTAMDYAKGIEDLMNGYTNRALEKTPKLFGNIAKANRFAKEGQLNYNRELVGMGPEFWSDDKVILQALAFGSTEADQRQQQNYEAKAIRADVQKAREDFLTDLRKVALDRYQYGPTPEVLEAEKEIRQKWVEFNQTYPTDVIGVDSFYEVQVNAVNDALVSRAARGLPMDEKGVKTPYLRDLYLRRLEEERQ